MSCLVIRPRCCRRQNSERESRNPLSIRKYYKIGIFTWLSQPLHLATINERLYLESPMSELHCPACGGSKIRLAARKSLSDVLLSGLTIYPFRCQLCADRFRTFLGRRTPNPRRSFERIEVSFPVWFRPRRSKYPDETGQMNPPPVVLTLSVDTSVILTVQFTALPTPTTIRIFSLEKVKLRKQ